MCHVPSRLVILTLWNMPVEYGNPKRWWMVTVAEDNFEPTFVNDNVCYIRGQLEVGGETGYRHWQVLIYLKQKKRFTWVKHLFHESAHIEPITNIPASLDYVWKDDTSVEGTQFEMGHRFLIVLMHAYD